MRVFVIGGIGAIGRHAVSALVYEGHAVTALEKASALAAQGAVPVTVSLFDASALAAAFVGHDAVVNLATAMPSMTGFVFRRAWRATQRIWSEGSAAVVEAARTAGCPSP